MPVFPWGDLSGRCTNGNGVLDTEDLNGDNVLNASGPNGERLPLRRAASRPGDKYFVRTGIQRHRRQGRVRAGSCTGSRSARRTTTIGTPNLRLIQHLRLTVAAPADAGGPTWSRGSRWRGCGWSAPPGSAGPSARSPGSPAPSAKPTGEVIASVVSTENRIDLGYESPPGVGEAVQRRDGDRSRWAPRSTRSHSG